MQRDGTGRHEITSTAGESVRAFVPAPLPPQPPVQLEGGLQVLHERALLACGRLDGVSTLLPDQELFLYVYMRREALLSSQIEGTQSSLSDLLLFELEEAPGFPSTMWSRSPATWRDWSTAWHGCRRASRSPPVCCAKSTPGCWPGAAEPTGCLGSSAAARSGSAAPAPATPASCRHPGTGGGVHGAAGALHPWHA